MTLKKKLFIFFSFIILILFVISTGMIMVFMTLRNEAQNLRNVNLIHRNVEELRSEMDLLIGSIDKYMATDSDRLKSVIKQRKKKIYNIINTISHEITFQDQISGLKKDFDIIFKNTETILNSTKPLKDRDALRAHGTIRFMRERLIDKIEAMHIDSINRLDGFIEEGLKIHKRLFINAIILILIGLLSTLILLTIIKRAIDIPFERLLYATDKISRGDMDYRIQVRADDEFGIISNRFNDMVDRLKKRFLYSNLLLDVARIGGTTSDIITTLKIVSDKIIKGLDLFDLEVFLMQNGRLEPLLSSMEGLSLENKMIESIERDLPLYIRDVDEKEEWSLFKRDEPCSMVVLPIFDDNLKILFILRKKGIDAFTDDEIETCRILIHILSSIITNARLNMENLRQYERSRILYEFGKNLVPEIEPDNIFNLSREEFKRIFDADKVYIRFADGEFSFSNLNERLDTAKLMEEAVKIKKVFLFTIEDKNDTVVIPVILSKEVKGIVIVKGKDYTSDELSLAEGLSLTLNIVLEKAITFQRILDSERKTIEAKKRIESIIDSVRGGIVTLNREYTITSINRFMERWIPSPESYIGKNAEEVFHMKVALCPHCVALAAFETGEMNFFSQKGVYRNTTYYTELTAYPVKDINGEVNEVIVFIQDVTERVLYQEELFNLFKEVMQTKDYLEGIIENSADAIVTSDLNGLIKSWNKGAERIYGFTEEEVLGKFLPFVPPELYEIENKHTERVKKGEVIRDIETYRIRKDGTRIEISLTLSPIKDVYGNVIGITGISRDITEKKHYEIELAKRNQELSRLFLISSAMRSTLELDKLLRMVLTAVTMSDGLGFNRAILFLVEEEKDVIRGVMGVGPSSLQEAWEVWNRLSLEKKTLKDLMDEIEKGPLRKESLLDRLSLNIEIPLSEDTIITRVVKEKKVFNITDVRTEPLSDIVLVQQLGTEAYAIVPLISRDKVIGAIWVDNLFNKRQITDDDIRFLMGLSNHVASAIENARLFERVRMAEQELENIFESISDMIYITTADYTIRSVNRAVLNRLKKKEEDIVGKKCYEVFHGMDHPYEACPHHKTVNNRMAYIEEFDDSYLGITTMSSTSPLFSEDGIFTGTVHVVRDISELKKLRERLQASEKMAALGEVAARVAHEIRNPLVSIGGFAKRLESKVDNSLKGYAEIIRKEVQRLEEILKDILSFVKEKPAVKERTYIQSIVEDIISFYSSELKAREIEVIRDYRTSLALEVDPLRIREALINIFTNAIHAINRLGVITVTLDMTGDTGVITISDTGHGIKEEDLPKIFEPFFTTKTEGTGLGLSITKRIITEHNGTIEVRTAEGKGTSFIIYLPINNHGGVL